MVAIRAHILHLLANVVQQSWVLLFNGLGDCRKLLLHGLVLDHGHLVAELDVLVDCLLAKQVKVTPEHLQILVGQNLVEEQVTRVVQIQLDLQAVRIRVLQG